ncbi:MAG: hypothetical protein HamCj_00900 [Candidatus Hamiltonella defensa (Ceratovacuna japonica)]
MLTNPLKTVQPVTPQPQRRFSKKDRRTAQARPLTPLIPLQGRWTPQQVLRAQSVIGNRAVVQLLRQPHAQKTPSAHHTTGLPEPLKTNMESLSGVDLSDVQVHPNSEKPVQLDALAYAQGNHIYLGLGQEQHLPHEAWHVVQQKQGRVTPTGQMKEGFWVNDNPVLEKEADECVKKAHQTGSNVAPPSPSRPAVSHSTVVQTKVDNFELKEIPRNTIVDVLKIEHLEKTYHLGVKGLSKNAESLNRATSAQATIIPEIEGERLKTPPEDYEKVKALGKWEHLASTHTQERHLDTGHLVADNFFAPDQKRQSYVAANLAPQDSRINKGDYNKKEKNIAEAVKKQQQVNIAVHLEYGNDTSFLLKTLVERGALIVNPEKQKHHDAHVRENKKITVPRRLPSKWTLNVVDQKFVTAHASVPIQDKIASYTFEQEHAFYDPEGTLNPIQILNQDKLNRLTQHQKLQVEALENLLSKPDIQYQFQNEFNQLMASAKNAGETDEINEKFKKIKIRNKRQRREG